MQPATSSPPTGQILPAALAGLKVLEQIQALQERGIITGATA